MATALRKPTRMSFDEYLEFEEATSTRHELIDGVVFAMAGASDAHNLICTNLVLLIAGPLQGICQVFQGGMKLRVDHHADSDGYYPDVMVSCAATDREKQYRREPILLIEVLSPSTDRFDRGEKRMNYVQIPSLQDYVLVAQDRPTVQHYRRSAGWLPLDLFPGETLELVGLDLKLPLADIYRTITF